MKKRKTTAILIASTLMLSIVGCSGAPSATGSSEMEMTEAELREWAGAQHPMGRMCERNDYMEGLIYLMSDASAMMTGSTFRLTAGEYI